VAFDLGSLESVLEGKFRPGHFQGVCRIVDKLLLAVKPDSLYIGQKDYQQCMVIKALIEMRGYRTQLRICDTVREPGGLAMSSRNLRLTDAEKQKATLIYRTLLFVKENIKSGDLTALKKEATAHLSQDGFKIDYVEIAKAANLELVYEWNGQDQLVALVAAFIRDVRLIDNMLLQNNTAAVQQ
jgi:pantoate--beta-alanine ligase